MRLSTTCLLITLATPTFSGVFAARAEEPPKHKPQAEASTPPQTPAELRSEIYSRLAASKDSDETESLVGLLLASYAQSGSDTGDLLISRARKAMKAKDFDDAGKILDATIALLPHWAEGWNARATLRYLDDDYDGSMADIAETLKREPRHLGALLGMATILEFARQEGCGAQSVPARAGDRAALEECRGSGEQTEGQSRRAGTVRVGRAWTVCAPW